MDRQSFRGRALRTSAALGLLSAALLLSATPARAASCPNVDPSTGAVSPAAGPGTQWPGCDLSGADLSGADLYGADLYGANLQDADLSKANLTQTDLANADMSDANLTGADLTQTSLISTVLNGATLTGVSSNDIIGPAAALPQDWSLHNGYLVGPGADLTYANLTGADLTEADLGNANLTDAKMGQTALAGADLAYATLTGVSSGSITGTPAALPQNWSLHNGYLVGPGADLYLADLSNQDLSGLTLTGIDLSNASVRNANLSDADLAGVNLGDAFMAGANLTGANLAAEQSGLIDGIPSALPAHWSLQGGFLIGPDADLQGDTLNGFQLSGSDLTGADLSNADLVSANLASADLTGANLTNATVDTASLTGANLSDANLTDTDLGLSNLTGADLHGADLTYAGVDATLTRANLSDANLTNTNFDYANLTQANLTQANLTQATVSGATFAGARWSDTTCPNGSNSDKYVTGCFSALDTTPPAVTVTGIGTGHVYVVGTVPAAGCRTTDNGTVAKAASVKVTTNGKNGVGRFTATCAGAVDLAGNKQKAAVSVNYRVAYGVKGFLAPASGATITRSSKTIAVRFRLTSGSGSPISASLAKALAVAHDVQATLRGPGIAAVTVNCGWNATQQDLACVIRFPSGVRTGTGQRYTITVTEEPGTGWVTAPGVRGGANPEVIHFR